MAVDASWTRYGRGNAYRNNLTGEIHYGGPGAPVDQAIIDKAQAREDTINKMASNIMAQGSMDHWTTGSGLSKESVANMMAAKLYDDGGITRLEDFGKVPIKQTLPIVNGHMEQQPYGYWGGDEFVSGYKNTFVPGGDQQGYWTTVSDSGGGEYSTSSYDVFVPLTPAEQAQVKDGKLVRDTGQTAYGNKVTGQIIPVNYDRAHPGDWGGTFAGDSSSGYGVKFNDMGMPMFYTHYDVDNSWMGPLGLALTFASFIPGVAPFAMAANAALQASQGNTVGAILSALGSTAGFVGSGLEAVNGMDLASDLVTAGSSANLLANIQTAQQAVGVLNAVSKGNLTGIINSLTQLSPQFGVTIPEDLMRPIQLAAVGSAVSKGDWAGALNAAGTLTKNSDIALAGKAARVVNAVSSGNMSSMLTSFVGFTKQAGLDNSTIKDAFKASNVAISDQKINDLLASSDPEKEVQQTIDQNKLFSDLYKSKTGLDLSYDQLASALSSGDPQAQIEHDAQVIKDQKDAKDRQDEIDRQTLEAETAREKAAVILAQEKHDAQVLKDAQDAKDRQDAIDKENARVEAEKQAEAQKQAEAEKQAEIDRAQQEADKKANDARIQAEQDAQAAKDSQAEVDRLAALHPAPTEAPVPVPTETPAPPPTEAPTPAPTEAPVVPSSDASNSSGADNPAGGGNYGGDGGASGGATYQPDDVPSGVNLASANTGTVSDAGNGQLSVEVSGVPIFSDSKNASTISPPVGYDLMPSALNEKDLRPAGAYYDITQNAWFIPNNAASNLNDALATNSDINDAIDPYFDTSANTGALPVVNEDTANEDLAKSKGFPDYSTYKYYGGDLKAYQDDVGIKESNPTLSNPNSTTDNSTSNGSDVVSSGGNGDASGDATDKSDVTEVVIKGSKNPCPAGTHYDEELDACVPDEVSTEQPTEAPTEATTEAPTETPVTLPGGGGTPNKPSTPSTTPTTKTPQTPVQTPTPAPSNPFEFKWLDSTPQMLKAAGNGSSPAHMAKIHQLYSSLSPEMQAIFASQKTQEPKQDDSDMQTQSFATGGTSNAQSFLDNGMPKFLSSPTALEAAPEVKIPSRMRALKFLDESTSSPETMAQGGLPTKYSEAAPKGHRPEFITGLTGYYAQGGGTGQSDDIPAMLHDGDYVIDADAVAAFGDGSSKAGAEVLSKFQSQIPFKDTGLSQGRPVAAKIADGEYVFPAAFVTAVGGGDNKRGAKILDTMRESLRQHKRSAPTSKIPPKAKSPLDYLKTVKG